MEHKRQRVQFGWVGLKARKKGPDVWALRYRENLPDGGKKRRSVAIGTVEEFPTEPMTRKAALSWLFAMNAEPPQGSTVAFGEAIQRYVPDHIPESTAT